MNNFENQSFFKPTRLYKDFFLLDLLEKEQNITQRALALILKISVSMVNEYLEDFVKKKWLKKTVASSKSFKYTLTKQGVEARKLLNLHYFKSSQGLYNTAALNIKTFFSALKDKGFKQILFYGAGEVTRIFLRTIQEEPSLGLKVLGLIDDDKNKIGTMVLGVLILSLSSLKTISFDGVLIASYNHSQAMIDNLVQLGISSSKILKFFDLKE
jgi:NADH/NAD ratio-sensing transcriptional regulator Rex